MPPQPGGYSMPPYPMSQPGYGDPGQAPPPVGFHMGYQPTPDQPVMYQPGPVSPGQPMAMHEYGGGNAGPPGAPHQYQPQSTPATAPPASLPVGVPPGLEYLTQVSNASSRSWAVKCLYLIAFVLLFSFLSNHCFGWLSFCHVLNLSCYRARHILDMCFKISSYGWFWGSGWHLMHIGTCFSTSMLRAFDIF